MTTKKRKYGDLSKQPLPQSDPTLLEDVFRAFTGRAPVNEVIPEEETVSPQEQYRETIPYQESVPYQKTTQYRRDTVSKNDTVPKSDTVPPTDTANSGTDPWVKDGHLKVSHYVSDVLAPQLTPTQWAVYYRLYRLSFGWGKNECIIGNKRLRELTRVKETAIREAITDLKNLGLIEVLEILNNVEIKGTRYRVNVFINPQTVPNADTVPLADTVSKFGTVSVNAPIKERHDHDLLKKDHRQSGTMTSPISSLFEKLTGKEWSEADTKAFQQVAHIPIDRLEFLMRTIHNRAGNTIGSFAYFAKAILTEESGPPQMSRAALKRKYEQFMKEIRSIHVGSNEWDPSDMVYLLKTKCAKEGITWNDDIANEILG
jgi:hypothetical protein